MRELRKFSGVATGFVVGASLATIVGVSAHGGNTTMIHACVNHAGGVRIVAASESCKQNETALDWNVQGLKGDLGLQGPKGDTGEQGPKGDTGASGPPGTFTGVFKSPNDAFMLSVTDSGIEMAGPEGLVRVTASGVDIASPLAKIKLDGSGLALESQTDLRVRSGSTLTLDSSASLAVKSAAILKVESGASLTLDAPVTQIDAPALLKLDAGIVLVNGTPIP